MEKREIPVRLSKVFNLDVQNIHEYGAETFGLKYADQFIDDLFKVVTALKREYALHPECRHLKTVSKKYRNIIMASYLVIYRVTLEDIQVLTAIHSSKSPTAIKRARSVKI